MTKNLLILLILCTALSSCGQATENSPVEGLTIDPTIKEEVEKRISPSEYGKGQGKILVYNNLMMLDVYENDQLNISVQEANGKSAVFSSFYVWQKDTLAIDGAYGLFEGAGFSIKIVNGKATLYHMVASGEIPAYAYGPTDSLQFRLEVPCTDAKIVLSEIPDPTVQPIIYGYVEFESKDYYASNGSGEGKEFLPRKKTKAKMRIYFKSAHLVF